MNDWVSYLSSWCPRPSNNHMNKIKQIGRQQFTFVSGHMFFCVAIIFLIPSPRSHPLIHAWTGIYLRFALFYILLAARAWTGIYLRSALFFRLLPVPPICFRRTIDALPFFFLIVLYNQSISWLLVCQLTTIKPAANNPMNQPPPHILCMEQRVEPGIYRRAKYRRACRRATQLGVYILHRPYIY